MIRNIVFDIFDVLIDPMEGPIHECVDLLMELKSRGFPLYAVTNMSTDGFNHTKAEYPFLRLFDGVVISGSIGLSKPDPKIFLHLLNQFNLEPSETFFIDDKASNVEGAIAAGIKAVRYENPRQLEKALITHQILVFEDQDVPHSCCGGNCGCGSSHGHGGCGCH